MSDGEQSDFFAADPPEKAEPGRDASAGGAPAGKMQPLAARMRPRALAEMVGQEHILRPGGLLARLVTGNRFGSLIFYGPPGSGMGVLQEKSGDVLSGYLAGLLSQPDLRSDVLKTIRYAVWQHGAAADALQAARANWVVEHLIETVGAVKG